MKKLAQVYALLFFVSCAGAPPYQSRKIKIWNGASEEAGICRMSTANLKSQSNIPLPVPLMKKIHQGYLGLDCIEATDPAFDKYACLTFSDLGVLYEYIETLINSCQKW